MPSNILDNLPDQTDILGGLPDQAPIEPDPEKKSESEAMMAGARKTAEDIGHVYPVAEAAAHIITNLYGLPISGFAGLFGLLGGKDTSKKWSQFTRDVLIYSPKTERGQRLTGSAMYPFELLNKGANIAQKELMDLGVPWYVAAGVGTAIEGGPALLGLRHAPKVLKGAYETVTKSQAWRQATIKERGLVVQTLEQVLEKNPKLTEAELIKKSDVHFKEALERRMVKKTEEAKQTKETARKMGEEIKEVPPVVEEVSPQVKEIFKEIAEPDIVALYRAESPTVKFKDVFDKEKLAKFGIGPGDKVGDFYTSDLNYAEYFKETYGKDALIKEIRVPKKELSKYEIRPGEYVIPKDFKVGEEIKIEKLDTIATLGGEIDALRKVVGKKGVKKLVRETTGQVKISDILNIKERDALKIKIQAEATAARTAFTAGKREATLKHKENQRELLIRQRAQKAQRTAIKKMVKDLKKIDTTKMSPQASEPINEILKNVDLTRITKKKKLNLESLKRHLENNPETELPEGRLNELIRLQQINLKDMSFSEFTGIYESVMHYVHLEKLKQKIRVGRVRKQAKQVLSDSVGEMKPPVDLSNEIVTSQSGGKPVKRAGQLIKDTFGIRHDHYDLIVETLAGPNSTMDKVLYRGVKEGVIKQYDYRQTTFKKFTKDISKVVKKVGDVSNWLGQVVRTGKFELTRNERMALYRHSLNQDNITAILKGGFGFRKSKTPNRIWKITPEELNEILDSLTPEETSFAGTPVDNLFSEQSEALSEVFYKKNGYPMPPVENYYPKEVMPLSRGSDVAKESALEEFRGKFVRVGLEKGMLIERVGSKLPIYLNDLTYDLNKSVLRAGAYVGLELPLSEASKLLYNNDFRRELSDRYGEVVWKEIEKGLRDIAGDYTSYTSVDELMLKAKNNLATAVLGLNPFVMAKQVLSLPIYLPYVKGNYLLEGFVEYSINRKEIMARHKIYSPEYLERIEGGYSRDVADVFKGSAEKRLFGGKQNIKEVTMKGIKIFDEVAVSSGMQGAVLQVLDEFKTGVLSDSVRVALDITEADIPNLSSSDKMRLAYSYADYATERTQPMFSPEHRSSLSRGSTTEKLFTMFGSFTNQALNLIRRGNREYQRATTPEQKTKAASNLAKILFLIGVVNPLGVMAIDRIRDMIYQREKTGSFAGKILNSYASYVFFLRDLVSSTISKIERGTYLGYDVDVPVMVVPNLMGDTVASGYEALFDRKKRKRVAASKQFIDSSLQLVFTMHGIPYATPKKLIAVAVGKKTKKDRKKRILIPDEEEK